MGEFFEKIFSMWYGVTIFCVAVAIIWILLSALLYRCFFKRFYDIILSGLAIVILSPLLIFLIICGAINMKGNPFFVQRRPGKNGKIFKLIKFRTMTAEKDEAGNFLPDDKRLTRYGRILRSSSLDELPELFNIFIGQMSVVGPRPLLVEYLDYYTAEENLRHSVRGGLTGWAQVNGRNAVGWDQRLRYDVYYVRNISLWFDIKIIFMTVGKVLCRSGLSADSAQSETNFADERRLKQTAEVESDD
jgi:general glycosylation pathway protein